VGCSGRFSLARGNSVGLWWFRDSLVLVFDL
jgi:hypothetical protein